MNELRIPVEWILYDMKRVFFRTSMIVCVVIFISLQSIQAQNNRILIVNGSGTISGSNKDWILIPFDLTKYQSGHYNIIVTLAPGTGISKTGGKCGARFTWAEAGLFPAKILTPKILPLPAGQGYNLGGDFNKPTKFVIALQANCDFDPKLSNEYKYEVYLEKGVSVPCEDEEIAFSYDSRSSNYHKYGPIETQICLTNQPQCTLKSVFSKMTSQTRFITPTEDISPVRNCMMVDVNIPGPWGKDHVRVVVNNANYSITNYTRKDHKLYPGKVTRRIVEKSGAIYVVTEGDGIGDLGTLNEWASGLVWTPVDSRLREAFNQRPTGK